MSLTEQKYIAKRKINNNSSESDLYVNGCIFKNKLKITFRISSSLFVCFLRFGEWKTYLKKQCEEHKPRDSTRKITLLAIVIWCLYESSGLIAMFEFRTSDKRNWDIHERQRCDFIVLPTSSDFEYRNGRHRRAATASNVDSILRYQRTQICLRFWNRHFPSTLLYS